MRKVFLMLLSVGLVIFTAGFASAYYSPYQHKKYHAGDYYGNPAYHIVYNKPMLLKVQPSLKGFVAFPSHKEVFLGRLHRMNYHPPQAVYRTHISNWYHY